jgi:hypothetical protein
VTLGRQVGPDDMLPHGVGLYVTFMLERQHSVWAMKSSSMQVLCKFQMRLHAEVLVEWAAPKLPGAAGAGGRREFFETGLKR